MNKNVNNLETLLQKHFDTAFDSPNGIKELRGLILKLAMMGKLVPQDANDQPASELLKEIQSEKKKLLAEGKIKKQKPLPKIKPEETPYELPDGWIWCQLSNTGLINPKNKLEDTMNVGFVPMPRIQAKYGEIHTFETRIWKDIKKGYTHFGNNDIGLAKITPCFENGKSCVFKNLPNGFGAGTTELHIYRNYKTIAFYPYFLLAYFKNPAFIENGKNKMTGSAGQKRVPRTYFSEAPVPLPPLNEQKRIVEKINELMSRCDEMERLKKEQQDKRRKISVAALHQLAESKDKNSFNSAFNFITNNFSSLYSVKENVENLKKAILQLAMMGKLVPQNPTDQPASELLKEIQSEKKKLLAEGKIRKQKPLPKIKPEEIPYELPDGWVWCRLGNVFNTISGYSFNKNIERAYGEIPYLKVADMNLPNNELQITTSSRYINPTNKMLKKLIPKNSIIFPKRGGAIATNKKRIVTNKCFVDLNIMAISILSGSDTFFLYYWLLNIDLALLNTGTSVPQINHKDIDPLLFPLPPLNEQKRIVAKINELMTLCDNMLDRIEKSEQTQDKLLKSILAKE